MNQSQHRDTQDPSGFDISRIKAVSFDLDDTLWPVGPVISHAENTLNDWLRKTHPRVEATLSAEQQLQIRSDVRAANPAVAHNLTEIRRLGIAACMAHAGYDDAQASHDAMAVFLVARNAVTPFEDVPHALARLTAQYPLIALSNGNADIKQTSLGHLFVAGVSAEAMGASKPHPSMFQQAAREAGCKPGELLHIGDHPHEDIQGALDQGCQAILVDRFDKGHSVDASWRVVTELTTICQWLNV